MISYVCNKPDENGMGCASFGRMIEKTDACDCEDEEQIIVKGVCPKAKIEKLLTPNDKLWTQIFVPEVLCVPKQKPDIEQLLSLTVVPEIFSQRVVKTPVLKVDCEDRPIENMEGTVITGRKLVLEGVLRQKVTYVAALECQSVHAAHFDVPFSAFIILPPKTKLTTMFEVCVCIEDIFICKVTDRSIFKNITLFINAKPLVCH